MRVSGMRFGLMVAAVIVACLAGSLNRCGTSRPHDAEAPPAEPLMNPCETASSQIDLNTNGQPTCIQANVSGLGGAVVVWKAPNTYYPWVRFEDASLTAPTINGNTASWAPPNGTTNKVYAFKVNIVKTTTPTPYAPTVTPTPQTYGRIIIDK